MIDYNEKIYKPFCEAISKYEMIKDGDRVAVCISGGKDSMLMAKLFMEYQKQCEVDFELEFIVMDPGYSTANRQMIETNASKFNIPVNIFETTIFETVFEIDKSPCYLCARMRRGHLYAMAEKLNCNKIALGHHYDDVIETILMGLLYSGQTQTMMPKLWSTNFEGMELIRPMYLIREDDIIGWRDDNNLTFLQCACKFTEENPTYGHDGESESKRVETKLLIKRLKKQYPNVEDSIFRSVENVDLDNVIAYKNNGEKFYFLEDY